MTRWTATDLPRQDGRTVIITGANSGIGFHTARHLAAAGAKVVLACRNADKAAEAERCIKTETPNAAVEVAPLDLASLRSVRKFAESFRTRHERLELLINNAGVFVPSRRTTDDGLELHFATNHLGHFALTGLLLSMMEGRSDARVVTVSGELYRLGRIDFDDLQGERGYGRWRAYCQSKLANLLFMFELDRRLRAARSTVSSLAAHPGYAATNLQRGASSAVDRFFGGVGNAVFAQSADMGALPTLYAASYPGVAGGTYVGPGGFMTLRGYPKPVGTTAAARDDHVAARLWQVSEELAGVSFKRPAAA